MNTATPRSNATVRDQLVSAANTFSFQLLKELADGQDNCFLSPFSVYSALSMLYPGSGTSTRAAIAEILRLPDADDQTLGGAFAGLWEDLKDPEKTDRKGRQPQFMPGREPKGEPLPAFQLDLANSLWVNNRYSLQAAFRAMTEQYYQGEVISADFSSSRAPERINRWVEEKTRGKITDIINQIDPATILLLLNAVYFKGDWTFPFIKEKTTTDDFYYSDGSRKPVPMMHLDRPQELRYVKTGELEAVRLPYGYGRMSMYIFLPHRTSSLEAWLHRLDAASWRQYLSQLHTSTGRVVLPRFQLDYSVTLNDALIQLGLAPAFDAGGADFIRMIEGPGPVRIDEVRHKTFLDVNETGTEAAAATAFAVVFGSMLTPPPPFHMVVDRPFFCAIQDDHTGLLLFTGAIYDPA